MCFYSASLLVGSFIAEKAEQSTMMTERMTFLTLSSLSMSICACEYTTVSTAPQTTGDLSRSVMLFI